MLCHVCKGAGCIMAFPAGKPEWWPCPCCESAGVSIQHGPPTLIMDSVRMAKNARKAARKAGVAP